jgi:hypothetical protein
MPLPFIITAFKLQNILLTSGSTQKRGVLSPVQHRLSQFNTCLEGIKKLTITESFHNYNSLAIQPIFDHSNLDKNDVFKISNFFSLLEKFFKFKINSINSKQDFNLRKNNKDINFDYNEFIEFCKSNKN